MNLLEQRRKARSLTFREVGEALGTDAANAARIISGRQVPAPSRIFQLSKVLKISVEKILNVYRESEHA